MGIEIDITSNFLDVASAFREINNKILIASARHSINRTLLTLRQQSINQVRKQLKVPSFSLRQKHIRLHKARGSSFATLYGVVSFNDKPLPLLEFVKGSKVPPSQKGVPVKRRRKVRVEIRPGRKFTLKKAFIQKVRTTQVFSRPKGKDGFKTQSVPSVAHLIMERGIGNNLSALGAQRFRYVFLQDLRARINGRIGKVRDPK